MPWVWTRLHYELEPNWATIKWPTKIPHAFARACLSIESANLGSAGPGMPRNLIGSDARTGQRDPVHFCAKPHIGHPYQGDWVRKLGRRAVGAERFQ